jgi:hypothetical protein
MTAEHSATSYPASWGSAPDVARCGPSSAPAQGAPLLLARSLLAPVRYPSSLGVLTRFAICVELVGAQTGGRAQPAVELLEQRCPYGGSGECQVMQPAVDLNQGDVWTELRAVAGPMSLTLSTESAWWAPSASLPT